MRKPELLAPAGNLEKLKIACLYGADAVFIGGKNFSLRARASNFDINSIEEACEFAHSLNKKVYVTTNIYPHNDNLDGLLEYLKELERVKVDAIIAASPVIIDTALKHTNLEVHLSTQASATNKEAVAFYTSLGVKRVVLARELTKPEISELKETGADLEVFIHGGMCVSYSGRCTLSNNMTERDANRGGCAHSCRWNYSIYDKHDKIDTSIDFSMSSKDLQTVSHIGDLIEIGVDSLKIEGRMKSIHYIATVVKTYRGLIDDLCEGKVIDINKYILDIKKAENRLTSVGFLDGAPTMNEQLYDMRCEQPTQEFIGLVLDYDEKNQEAIIEQRNKFIPGDQIELFRPFEDSVYIQVDEIKDIDGNSLDAARHPRQLLRIKVPIKLEKYNMIRKVIR